jgi:hypothetical protein
LAERGLSRAPKGAATPDTLLGIERHFREIPAARLAAREKQSQQHSRPVISVHK